MRACVEREGGRESVRVRGGESDSVCVSCAREGERANEVPCGGYVAACCSVGQYFREGQLMKVFLSFDLKCAYTSTFE